MAPQHPALTGGFYKCLGAHREKFVGVKAPGPSAAVSRKIKASNN